MKRLLPSAIIAALAVVALPLTAVAQEGPSEHFVDVFTELFDPDHAEAQDVVAITVNGVVILIEGHDPQPADTLILDFSEARGFVPDALGDADPIIDIAQGWANIVHLSDPVRQYMEPNFVNFSAGAGFFASHRGDQPAFPSDSVLFGVELTEPITEDDSFEIRADLGSWQSSLGFVRLGVPIAETGDANDGFNASIDAYPSDGLFGMDSYYFPAGVFEQQPTAFFGFTSGSRMSFGGPWTELDGASGFVFNTVLWPEFDGVALGDLEDFGIISVYMLGDMDANGNGVYDPLESADAEVPATEDPPAGEPATEVTGTAQEGQPPPTDESGAPEPAPVPEAGGVSPGIIITAVVLLGGGLLYYLKNREQVKCKPEADALAAAKAKVASRQADVDKARAARDRATEHLAQTEANAREQRELRIVEARQVVSARQSDLSLAEGELEDARAEEAAAQYAYDVCMGFVTPAPEPDPAPAPEPPPPPPVSPPTPPAPADPGPGQPGVADPGPGGSTTAPPPPPPRPEKKVCEDGATRNVEERTGSFTVAADETVRISLGGEDGPLDDVEDLVSGTPIADMITDFLTPDSLGVGADSLNAGAARSWQSALEKMAGTARTEIEVVIAYDVDDVTLVCIRQEVCRNNAWVTVGHRVEETSRTRRTVEARWETVSSTRPLGATFTSVRRGLDEAAEDASAMDAFSSGCS